MSNIKGLVDVTTGQEVDPDARYLQSIVGYRSMIDVNSVPVVILTPNTIHLVLKATYQGLKLPQTCVKGTIFKVVGMGEGLWGIQQFAGQQIIMGDYPTTVGTNGAIQATYKRDTVDLLCVVADTTFLVINSTGNISVIQ
ncbi:MAG TPA: hypothetical protein PLE74_00900 [Candidatus Cloacimonadota bacterium]|mgnify:CR=1 FL=1|nr:hypothetical protein [Candidatus Cloacimonadota bacterium]